MSLSVVINETTEIRQIRHLLAKMVLNMLSIVLVTAAIAVGVVLRLFLPFFRKLVAEGKLIDFFRAIASGKNEGFETNYLKHAAIALVLTLLTGTGIFASIEVSDYNIAGFSQAGYVADLLVLLSAFMYGYMGQTLTVAIQKWSRSLLDNKALKQALMPDNLDPEVSDALGLTDDA